MKRVGTNKLNLFVEMVFDIGEEMKCSMPLIEKN